MKLLSKYVYVVLLITTMQTHFCMGQSAFSKIYYGVPITNGGARANAVIQTSDNGFVVAGTTKNLDVMYALKTNNLGDTLWTFAYNLGVGGADYIQTAIETSDGNYILGGSTRDVSDPLSFAFLIKLKPNGDTVWVRKIGGILGADRCYSVKQTADGGFVFCGLRYYVDALGNATHDDVYLVKTDSLGYPEWEKVYGGAQYEGGASVEITDEGGYMITGTTSSYGASAYYSLYLIKTDSLGNLIWQKTYADSIRSYGTCITRVNDGNYVLAGGTYIAADTVAAYVLKVDTAGTVMWEKRYNGNYKGCEFNAIKELPTGELMVSGDQQGDALNNRYYGITKKLNLNGNIIWEKEYEYYNTDTTQHYFYSMDLSNDGGLVMAGIAVDLRFGANPRTGMWLVKTDSNGCDNTVCLTTVITENDYTQFNSARLFPNPNNGNMLLEYNFISTELGVFILYDLAGREIAKYPLKADTHLLSISEATLNNGIYFYKVISGNQLITTSKIIIIK